MAKKPIELRDYQKKGIETIKECYGAGDDDAPILMIPTGGGKTVIAAHIMQSAASKYKRCTFVVDRVNLVDQTSALLDQYGIDHGVIQAGHWRYRPYERIQICSAQTIEKWGAFPKTDLLIVDECHAIRKVTAELIKNRKSLKMKVLGLSASPFTKGLGGIYSSLVSLITTNQLVEEGFLVPIKMYAAQSLDMTGAKVVAGEWAEKDIEKRGMEIIGDIVTEWADKTQHHFGGPVKTIVFSATVDHGDELCRQFNAAGFNFQQISYRDSDEVRRGLIEEFRKSDSEIHGLVSCEVFTKGFDVPDILCGIAARPYRKSLSSHIQQLGRVMRTSPGKEFGLWLDHCGNIMRFKADADEIFASGLNSLDDGARDAKARKEPEKVEREAVCCSACGYVLPPASKACPSCGKERALRCTTETRSGVMVEVGASNGAKKVPAYLEDRQSVWLQLCGYAAERKKGDHEAARKFAQAQYQKFYHEWPKHDYAFNGLPIADELKHQVMRNVIAYAKAQGGNRASVR
jgi:DNA repair protein RadD